MYWLLEGGEGDNGWNHLIYFRFGKLNRSLHGGGEQLFRLLVIDSRMGGEGGERGTICTDFELGEGGTGGVGGFARESSIGIHFLYNYFWDFILGFIIYRN